VAQADTRFEHPPISPLCSPRLLLLTRPSSSGGVAENSMAAGEGQCKYANHVLSQYPLPANVPPSKRMRSNVSGGGGGGSPKPKRPRHTPGQGDAASAPPPTQASSSAHTQFSK